VPPLDADGLKQAAESNSFLLVDPGMLMRLRHPLSNWAIEDVSLYADGLQTISQLTLNLRHLKALIA
jgi:hypothetical protein